MFKLQDGDYFRRWQRGMKIVVSDSSVTKVYFTTKAMDSAIEVDVVDGVADVPNPLLRQAYDITVYCYVDGKVKMKVFGIKDREKPADYECWREEKDPKPKYVTREEYVEEMQDVPNLESGGGIGGGSTGGGRFDINATPIDGSACTLDKTFDEIKSAYDSGMVVSVIFDDLIIHLSSIDIDEAIFNGIMDTGSNVMIAKINVSRTAGATYSLHTINY